MATVSELGTETISTLGGNVNVGATPAVGDLIVAAVVCTGIAGGTTAVTDNNADGLGTYTQVDIDRTGFSTTGVLTIWVRNALIGSATSTTFTGAQTGSSGGGIDILKITGMSRTGSSAVRQTAGQSSQGGGTTPSPVMGVAVLTSNPVIGCLGSSSNPANVTPRTGYTETCDVGYNSPATGFEVMFISSGETGTTLSWGSTSGGTYADIVIELDSSAVTTPSLMVGRNRLLTHRLAR